MATINSVNNSLSGSTGSGNFAGSNGCAFLGNVDASSSTEVIIPSSTTPSTSLTGQLALDTSVSGFPPLLQYNNGSASVYVLGMDIADLSANNNYVIKYSSASSKLYMTSQLSGTAGKLAQYVIGTSTASDTTTSTTAVSTSLTASITPTNASSYIIIRCYGYGSVSDTGGGSIADRYATFQVRRTSGTAATIREAIFGRTRQSASTASAASYSPVSVVGIELAGSTSTHTYVLRFYVPDSNLTATLSGDLSAAKMVIFEVLP